MYKLFDYAANTFGSFNRGDGATIVVVVSVVLLIIGIGLAAYGASRKPETVKTQVIMGIGTIVGFFAFVGVAGATLSSIKTSEQTNNTKRQIYDIMCRSVSSIKGLGHIL